jgi:hypothetical protein
MGTSTYIVSVWQDHDGETKIKPVLIREVAVKASTSQKAIDKARPHLVTYAIEPGHYCFRAAKVRPKHPAPKH